MDASELVEYFIDSLQLDAPISLTAETAPCYLTGVKLWHGRMKASRHPEILQFIKSITDYDLIKPGFVPLSPLIGDHLPVEDQYNGGAVVIAAIVEGMAITKLPIEQVEQEALRIMTHNLSVWILKHAQGGLRVRRERLKKEARMKKPPEQGA